MKAFSMLLPWKAWMVGLVLLGMTWPCVAQAQDYQYRVNSDGSATITGYTGAGGAITLPGTLDGRVVTRIAESAFEDKDHITSVSIPGSIRSVEINAFQDCDFLSSVRINNGARVIGSRMFAGCPRLISISIPGSVTEIRFRAFAGCTRLASISIPSSVTAIDGSAFEGCLRLATIRVGSANPAYRSMDGVLFNKRATTLVSFPGGKATRYVIPNSVVAIGQSAFAGCRALTRVTLPNNLRVIRKNAFMNCRGLTRLAIPNRVQTIEEHAFWDCDGLIELLIPDSVTAIGDSAWCACDGLSQVSIGNGVVTIGGGAFGQCRYLRSVSIGSNVTTLDYDVFYACPRLTAVLFQGDAPAFDRVVFSDSPQVVVYHLPGASGWGAAFAGRPTRPGDQFESDNTKASAKSAPNGRLQFRSIHRAGDTDWIRFTVGIRAARNVTFETAGSAGDTQIWLFNAAGQQLAYDDNSGVGDFSKIALPALPPGTYYGRIREFGNDGILPGYRLRVRWANAS